MPLFSPSLHQIAALPGDASPNGDTGTLVFHDATTRRGARVRLADHAQDECFVFSMIGLTSDSTSVTNFTVNTVTPRLDFRWPFDFVCTGIMFSVSARADGGTAAQINIVRTPAPTIAVPNPGSNSLFNNASFTSSVPTTGFCNIASGTPTNTVTALLSATVAPHASHVNWGKGDRLRFFVVAGANGSTTQSRNFHAPKVYIKGYRN